MWALVSEQKRSFRTVPFIPMTNVWRYAPEISNDIISCFDPLGNATHTAALQYDMIWEDVIITGAGPIRMMAAAIASHVAARNVVIIDLTSTALTLRGAGINKDGSAKEDLPSCMDSACKRALT